MHTALGVATVALTLTMAWQAGTGVGAAAIAAGQEPRPRLVQPGAPGEPTREIDPRTATDTRGVQHTAADIAFMQGMLAHHGQALEMTALVPGQSGREDIRRLAERIAASQVDEMAMMRQWLERRGATVPAASAHAGHHPGHGAALMPGMLTADEMARLRAATGAEFDRLFLAGMIRHHEGALVMVRDLLSQPGAGQEPELFAFVSDIEADQGMEIRRMGRMLGEMTR